jgi:CDP-diacylglycerol--glycerol-3-phosphate 3-phosphatidyltransferase
MTTGDVDRWLTIPNALSAYRLVMAPVLIWLALSGHRTLFITFFCISLVSDVLDGLIARGFNMKSRIGPRLDSFADDLTYVAAFVGLFSFQYEHIQHHLPILFLFMFVLALTTIIPLVKFGRTPGFHLYSFRANGYLQGFLIFYLFVFGFNVHLYYAAMIFGILASLEVIAVALVADRPITDARGLYWVLKQRRS